MTARRLTDKKKNDHQRQSYRYRGIWGGDKKENRNRKSISKAKNLHSQGDQKI